MLADCLAQPEVVRALYTLAGQAVAEERGVLRGMATQSAEPLMHRAVRVLSLLLPHLSRLRSLLEQAAPTLRSEGLRRLARTVGDDLDDAFFAAAHGHLNALDFQHGMLLSAGLTAGGYGTDHVLRRRAESTWTARLQRRLAPRTVRLDDDEATAQAVGELTAAGIREIAIPLAQSADHVADFFAALRRELGFYVGCLNLHERLTAAGAPVCFPEPVESSASARSCGGLYDPVLVLRTQCPAVANDLSADDRPLIVVTGVNEGGKSTFLRSLGLAQLMMQAGMFVAATALRAPIATGVFTHFRREEDGMLTAGKLDEELARMGRLIDSMGPGALLLSNESFASTNEREGARLAEEIVTGLLDSGVTVALVTHLFQLADGLRRHRADQGVFLRTQRRPDGTRTYRLHPGEPEPLSAGRDLFDRIIGDAGR